MLIKVKFLIIFSLIACFLLTSQVWADTLHVTCSTCDAYMSMNSTTNWTTVRDAASCNTCSPTAVDHRSGVWGKTGSNWYDRRAPMVFPSTANLDDDATITACTLFVRVLTWIDSDNENHSLHHIVNGFYHCTITASDFELGTKIGTNSGGSRDFHGLATSSWHGIKLDSTQWIDKTDTTFLALISDPTLTDDSLADNESEAIPFSSADGSYPPYLKIYYPGGEPPDSLRTDGEISPGLVGDTMPELTARYQDTRADCDSVLWQVGTTLNGSEKWNSGWLNVANIASGNWIDTVDYAGSALSRATWYYIRVITKNASGNTSGWSDPDSFRVVSDDTVYVVIYIDTESGNANMGSGLHPLIYFDTWHQSGVDTGYGWETFQDYNRDSCKDSKDNPYVLTWVCMMAEPYCSAYTHGFGSVREACTCVYDTLTTIWGDSIESKGDQLGAHFHNFNWSGATWVGNSTTLNEDEFECYLRFHLYYGKTFASVYRAGWNNMHQSWSAFLDARFLIDHTNMQGGVWTGAPSGWKFYHPDTADFTNEGNNGSSMNRYIGQITASGTMTKNGKTIETGGELKGVDVASLYSAAATNGKAVGAFFRHPFEDIVGMVETVHGRLKAKTDSTGIPFFWGTANEAIAFYYDWTDTTAPTFNFVDVANDSMRVRTSEAIFQSYPYGVTVDYGADPDTLIKVEMNAVDDTTFKYSLLVYPHLVICAATDTCGNVGVDSTGSEREGGIVRIYKNGRVKKIYENGEIVKIYEP